MQYLKKGGVKMNRWEIYEALRRGNNLDVHKLEETDLLEIREGLIEFMLMKEREGRRERG